MPEGPVHLAIVFLGVLARHQSSIYRDLEKHTVLALVDPDLLWRVASGALRIDGSAQGQPARFVPLASPGDFIGVTIRNWSANDADTDGSRGDQTAALPSGAQAAHRHG